MSDCCTGDTSGTSSARQYRLFLLPARTGQVVWGRCVPSAVAVPASVIAIFRFLTARASAHTKLSSRGKDTAWPRRLTTLLTEATVAIVV